MSLRTISFYTKNISYFEFPCLLSLIFFSTYQETLALSLLNHWLPLAQHSKTNSEMSDSKPHAVLIPYPVQGHINPLLQLAKLLHLRGFHITYVNTEYNHKRLLKSRGQNAFNGFTDFSFESIPDGLTPTNGDGDVSQDIYALCKSIRKNFLQPFRELLAILNDSATSGLVPPVTCIVSDISMSFTIQAAEELSIPNVFFSPSNACTFLTGIHLGTLLDKGLIPLKGNN